jgi:hypothetical protein
MIDQARFTYTDEDMVATQLAGWAWCAHWRNLLVVCVAIGVFEGAVLAGLNAAYGTRIVPADAVFVIATSAALTVLLFGLLLLNARTHGRRVLRARPRWSWDGDESGGEHTWAWNGDGLRISGEHKRTDLSWSTVGAWLNAPKVLLLFPAGGRAFSLPKSTLAAGWQDAPKVFLLPFGGYAIALPKRALAAGDANRLLDTLRASGVPERRRFGLIAAKCVVTR